MIFSADDPDRPGSILAQSEWFFRDIAHRYVIEDVLRRRQFSREKTAASMGCGFFPCGHRPRAKRKYRRRLGFWPMESLFSHPGMRSRRMLTTASKPLGKRRKKKRRAKTTRAITSDRTTHFRASVRRERCFRPTCKLRCSTTSPGLRRNLAALMILFRARLA